MTGRILSLNKRLLFSLLILMSIGGTALAFQTKVNGVINIYGRVTGIGTDYVIVSDPVQFSRFTVGDTVLIIQMKGIHANATESISFGGLENYVGSPGKYEFIIIQSTDGGLKKIIFRNNLVKSYDVSGDVQIIKTPSYNSVLVDADLTSTPWDSVNKIGGVLTMIVGRTIKLNANIDVTGKGFLGGGTVPGLGFCINADPLKYNKYSYHLNTDSSGMKGESPVSKGFLSFLVPQVAIFPSYFKGKGPNFTGGGGGNGIFSGGGGGANYGSGGRGGKEKGACLPTYIPADGGSGGKQIEFTVLAGGIFFGAGGGSSTNYSGSTPTPGGNGGGIIIILCDTIIGNGKIIKAEGAGASGASGNAGAGGGGGGGSIALYLSSFSESNITLSAKGGKGGDNAGTFGEGGGGGGGLIWINSITIPANVTQTIAGGLVGTRSGTSSGTGGAPGKSQNDFVALLNGFLFNSIRSSVSGDQVDSICSNMIPKPITGTNPVGGSGSYTYLWQKSYNLSGLPTNIPSSNNLNYSPASLETNTVYFRRVVRDDATSLTDTSKWVKIIVQPFIKNNIIGTSDTICFAQDPQPFSSKAILQDGNGKYDYKWQVSLDNTLFNLPVNLYSSEGYTAPPALGVTSWYRRTVTSGRCIDSTAIVKITVLDSISNNKILNSPPDICYGMSFTDLSATTSPALAGGDNAYLFKWESSVNGTTWVTATGVNNGIGYNPDELSPSYPGNEYYRRIVYSGKHNVCINMSTPVLLKDFPVLTNNTISSDQTIGHDSIPLTLTGSLPANGNGSYTYLWYYKTSILPWTIATGINNSINYSPSALTDTTWYRRVVNSSACSDISNTIVVKVHKTIINNSIAFTSAAVEDTICDGSTPAIFKGTIPSGGSGIPGDYSFQWYYSLNNAVWNPVAAGGTSQDYQPGALTATTYFRRNVSSPIVTPTSVSKSNVIKITVLPLISNFNIASSQTICFGTIPAVLQGVSLTGGDNIYRFKWQDSTNVAGWTDITGGTTGTYQPPNLTLPAKYRRFVYSGNNNCCANISNTLSIGINALPTGTITTTTDTTVCEGSQIPVKLHLTGSSKWKVTYTENGTTVTINKILAADTTLFFKPATANSSAIFNYALSSVQDNNTCLATSLTGTRKLTIYKIPNAIAGSNAAICGPDYSLNAIPSVGLGTWSWAKISTTAIPGSATFSPYINSPNAKVSIDSVTAAWDLENKYKFIWKEANWLCTDKDSVVITFNKRTGLVDAGPDRDLYSFDNIDTLKALKPLVGNGLWAVISGGATITNDSIVTNLTPGENKFEWTVTNGVCVSKDQAIINVFELKIPEGFSPNSDLINDEFLIQGLDLAYNEVTLRILNSAGTEVFFTSNENGNTWTNWNGEGSSGTLPEGTYYYLMTIKSKRNSTTLSKSGFIILKRYNSQ
jgi:gliding motility-associated-like protein